MYMISYEKLHEQLMYNPWNGYFYWKIKPSKAVNIGDIAGTKASGYIQITIKGKQYLAHRLAWFYVKGYWPENDIDHKDQIKHHNWIKNIREASKQCNARNRRNPKTNTSGVKGITWHKHKHKWQSSICVNGKHRYLGGCVNFDDAVCARLAGEQCLNWEGCDSCSPAYQYVKEYIQGRK